MLNTFIDRFRPVPTMPEIEVTPDHIKEQIAEEGEATRRELARLQMRALRLATEYRQQGDNRD